MGRYMLRWESKMILKPNLVDLLGLSPRRRVDRFVACLGMLVLRSSKYE